MSLDRAILERLRAAASGFVTKNHGSYLAEAFQCTRKGKDPLEAIRLLVAMWDSSYASRPDQKTALNDVGKWLEERLYRDPSARADAIALELGWLRRLARIAAAAQEREDAWGPRGASAPSLAFGKRVARIEEQREAAIRRAPVRAAATVMVAPPPPPDRLPSVFEAEFVDFADARKARRTAREREEKGKPRKERLLEIRPTDPRFAPLAAGLVCSVMETQGCSRVRSLGPSACRVR